MPDRSASDSTLFAVPHRPSPCFDAHAALCGIADAVLVFDVTGGLAFLNPAAERMLGCRAADAVGRALPDLCLVTSPTTRLTAADPLGAALAQSPHVTANAWRLVRRDGAEIAVEESAAPIVGRNGEATGTVLVLRDVGPTMQAALADAHRALHDPLTGLGNRRLLRERLGEHCAGGTATTRRLGVAFLDLDGLKAVNDVLGHDAGDDVLCATAARLVAAAGRDDLVCRHGGDEFVVLFAHVTSYAQARRRARRLLQCLAPPHPLSAGPVRVSASLGLAVWPDDGATPEALLTTADGAMYRAKRGTVSGFAPPAIATRLGSATTVETPRAHTLQLSPVRRGGL